jgi:hypothetical protein
VPGHLAAVTHVRYAELGVLLVATAFLALAAGVEVVGELTVAAPEAIVVERALEEGLIIVVDANCHHHLHRGGVPVAICERCEIVDGGENCVANHSPEALCILAGPPTI